MLIERDGRYDLDLDALGLTEAQRAALVIDRHVVVSAGAGSGKTHTLSWRYVRLLLAHIAGGGRSIESVVVLTFTEKAAEEMAERCRSKLAAVATWARRHGIPVAGTLEHLLDRFELARISTFHSFCARLLAENPWAAPDVGEPTILEPDDAASLQNQAANDVIGRWTREHHRALPLLLDTFGSRRSLLEALLQALRAGHGVRERLAAHAADAVKLHWDPAESAALRQWIQQTGIPTLRALRVLTAPGQSSFSEQLEPFLRPPPDDDLALHRHATALLGTVIRPDGTLRNLTHASVLGLRRNWPDSRRYTKAKRALATLQERLADWPARYAHSQLLPTTADRQLLRALVPFGRLVAEAREQLLRAQRERSLIDFDRLQDAAVDAVQRHPELRARLRERHRYLMVDEFQDTDPRQWAMVKALGDAEPGEPADRVFLVGDVKQAIYGFRGGDPSLFHRAAAHLGTRPLDLPDNFRSRSGLIQWFNGVFPSIFGDGWAPILPGRSVEGGEVRWIEAETVDEQATAVCAFVRDALESGWLGERAGASSPPFALLLRSRTRLGIWETALRNARIPYQIAKGVGFWGRMEVLDVVNLAHAACTGDPVSWAGTLRAPFLDASEDEVHRWRTAGELPAAAAVIQRLARNRRHRPLLAWLHESLDQLDAWSHWDADARANVERLLELIGSWNLPALQTVERLLDRVQRQPRATEADVGAGPARVVIMTVHAAKGLQFPVVILPELAHPPRPRPSPLTMARTPDGWIVATAVDDPEAPVQRRVRPALLHLARRTIQADRQAESARLLYVALTRAEDHLLLVGPRQGPAASWASLLGAVPPSTRFQRPTSRPASAPPPSARRWEVRRHRAPAIHRRYTLRASDLEAASSCVARWYRSARLGLSPTPTLPQRIAGARGDVLHSLIEDRALDAPALAARRWRCAARAAGLDAAIIARESATLELHRRRCARDPRLRAILEAPGFDELAVRAPFPGGILKGRIDRLIIDRERSGFVVVDYKTAGRDPAPYRLQLLAYAWAAQEVLQTRHQPPVVGAVLVFTAYAEHHALTFTPDERAEVPGRLAALAAVEDLDHAEAIARTQLDRPCPTCSFAEVCRARRHTPEENGANPGPPSDVP